MISVLCYNVKEDNDPSETNIGFLYFRFFVLLVFTGGRGGGETLICTVRKKREKKQQSQCVSIAGLISTFSEFFPCAFDSVTISDVHEILLFSLLVSDGGERESSSLVLL